MVYNYCMSKSTLDILKELQAAHDGLKTIRRDLSALPPDMASLDKSVKAAERRIQEIETAMVQVKGRLESNESELDQAVKGEESARRSLKTSTNKGQYTLAMRLLEEKERQIEAAQRAAKECGAALLLLESELKSLIADNDEQKRQFEELHEIFLSEHENQVVGKERLGERIGELEAMLEPQVLEKFNRLMLNRNGRAVVPMERDVCTGCNTRLRTPLVYKLRAEGSVNCESCQRILYIEQKNTSN